MDKNYYYHFRSFRSFLLCPCDWLSHLPFCIFLFFLFVSLHRRASDAKQTNFCRINGVFFPFALLLLLCVMLEPCMANIFSALSINRNSRKLCGEKKKIKNDSTRGRSFHYTSHYKHVINYSCDMLLYYTLTLTHTYKLKLCCPLLLYLLLL